MGTYSKEILGALARKVSIVVIATLIQKLAETCHWQLPWFTSGYRKQAYFVALEKDRI